jgi:hypothetical protein
MEDVGVGVHDAGLRMEDVGVGVQGVGCGE